MWTLQWTALALQFRAGISWWKVPAGIGSRRRDRVFIPLPALLLGHEVTVAQFLYERP